MHGKYQGSVLQGIPISAKVRSDTGVLSIDGRLSCRANSYISAGTGSLSIGEGCFFNQNVMAVSKKELIIGKNVIVGPNVVIVDHDHNYKVKDIKNTFVSDSVVIGDNVWIGANVTILKGTNIGENSVVAAGTILQGKFPENSLIYQDREIKIKTIEREK